VLSLTACVSSNVFPHSTFNWVGIDGTQVLCHMTPVGECNVRNDKDSAHPLSDTYTAQASVGDVNKGQTNHKVGIFSLLVLFCGDFDASFYSLVRTSSQMQMLYLFMGMVMVEAAPFQR
jgi:hypothetical protein